MASTVLSPVSPAPARGATAPVSATVAATDLERAVSAGAIQLLILTIALMLSVASFTAGYQIG